MIPACRVFAPLLPRKIGNGCERIDRALVERSQQCLETSAGLDGPQIA
jgi:hypothetical protein